MGEIRMSQFRQLLEDKQISAFSTWEKELQKIVFDPRYLLLTSKERKLVFEKYTKDRANQESKEKAQALKRKRDAFRSLIKEFAHASQSTSTTEKSESLSSSSSSIVNITFSFSEFSLKNAKDERFKQIDKMNDRELLFNDFVADVRKQEKEEKNARCKKAFLSMLKELSSTSNSSGSGSRRS